MRDEDDPGRGASKVQRHSLSLAALVAIETQGETDKVRVVFDTTHGVRTNHTVKVGDQVRNPISVDVKAVMTKTARCSRGR